MVDIIGAGGGKGGSYRPPVEAPNTLQSDAEVTIVEALSTGPIVGFVDGDKDIYFNNTPLRTAEGTLTYQGVSWDARTGTPDQEEFPSIDGVESVTTVGVEVSHLFPKAVGPARGSVSRTLMNTNATHVRIILGVNALYHQEIDDEERAGDTNGTEIAYSIRIKNSLNTTIVSYTHSRKDKTMSSAQWAHKFALDGHGPWIVTVDKETEDSEITNLQNDMNWVAFVEIVGYPMTYPYLAVVMVKGSAETFGESIPDRCYKIKGKIISIPSNYNPVTRAYTGVWDGTFKQGWTDNPAWVFYDMVMSERYGLSKFFPAQYKVWLTMCDKWGLYEIAQLCDTPVPDGKGGTEPRYSFNMQILGSGSAAEVLQSIASAFHGLTYWASGSIFVRTDFPQDAVMTLTQANVEGGLFTYQTGSLQERHSVVLVSWNDPDDFGNSRIEPVIDWELYSTFGYRPINMTAYGCASRGLAHRHGKWLLATEKEQWQCEVNAGLDSFGFVPGDFVRISDPKWMGYRLSGRMIAIDETKKIITLDAPVTLNEAETYQLGIALPDGTEEYQSVVSTGTVTNIVVSTAFSIVPIDGAVWHLSGTETAPRIFAIRGIKEETKGKINISLREVNPLKYVDVESNLFLTDTPGAVNSKGEAVAPTNLAVTESSYILKGLVHKKLVFSWQGVLDSSVSGYEVLYQSPSNDWTTLPIQKYFSVAVLETAVGSWTFKVRTRLIDGRVSTWATIVYVLEEGILCPAPPTLLTAEPWFGTVILNWVLPTDPLCDAVEVYASETNDVETASYVGITIGSQFDHFVGTFVGHYYWIRSVGTNGQRSDWSQTEGVWGKSDQDSHQDFVDLVLQENPYLTEVQSDLNSAITLVQSDLNSAITLVQSDLNSAITLVDTNIKTIDLPAYEQRIADRIDEVNDGIMTQVNTFADGAIGAMLDASETLSVVRDAGIITNPATGLTSIFALDVYKTANDARVSTVEIDLDAVESTLTSKVTLAQVDERIAGAVFGDPTELILSGMDARIVTVEEGLDAVEGTLIEKASVVDVNALGGRIGTAESRLDGQDAEIALLATSQELDAVESRVTTAEVNIDALAGSITQVVSSSVTDTKDEEEVIAQGLVDAMLNDQENKDETRERSRAALAIASTKLYAHIDDGLNAEAGERTLLAAQVAGNTSAIQTESATRASADSAMASQITTLVSAVSGNTSGIQTEATTRANADDALSSAISTVSATANAKNKTYRQTSAPTSGMTAGDLWFDIDANNKPYRYSGSAWVATDDTRIAANTAAIQSETTARANADSSLASQITTLQGTVGDNTSAIQSEATARANADNAIAQSVNTLQTTVGENTSSIQTLASSVDGIEGKYAVKIDVNGYVTGYELIGTGASSAMVFLVDNFIVGKPGQTSRYPFVIGTVGGVTRVSIDSAFIQDLAISSAKIADAAINNAKIENATITKLKIAGHELTAVSCYFLAIGKSFTYGWNEVAALTINTIAGYNTPIVFTATISGT